MKRLVIILMLSVYQMASAQQSLITIDKLEYDLSWSLLGLWEGYAGKAQFSFKQKEDKGYTLSFQVVCPDSVEMIDAVNNGETVQINPAGQIQEILYTPPDFPCRSLKINYADSIISYQLGDSLINTISMGGNVPQDIFSAIFLREWSESNEIYELPIIGRHPAGSGIAWKTARVAVEKEIITTQNRKIECLKITVVMDPDDNLIFNGEVKFGKKTTLWVTKGLTPVKLETKIKLLGIINIKAELQSLIP